MHVEIGRAERFLEESCWQLLRGASWIPVESQQVRERPFGLSAEGAVSNALQLQVGRYFIRTRLDAQGAHPYQ